MRIVALDKHGALLYNRGNVVDMAVGVIVGSSFTAIVNAMSNQILKPIINWMLALCFGANSLSELYTFLKKAYKIDEAGNQTVDLANSIYIDWGAFINAVINFMLVALVLFTIVKLVNSARSKQMELATELMTGGLTREERAALKKAGIRRTDRDRVNAFIAEKKRLDAEKKAAEDAAAEEKARLEREQNPTAEDLLKQILATLREGK